MQKLIIKGKRELKGSISISGSKIHLCQFVCIYSCSKVRLKNVPLVKDIFTMVELLNFIGLKTNLIKKKLLKLLMKIKI